MSSVVVVFSGGLDSSVCLALAEKEFDKVYALSFLYGQRHSREIDSAEKIVARYKKVEHIVVDLDFRKWGGSALTDTSIDLPTESQSDNIPVTYVPGRNIVFLSVALSFAEARGASSVYMGVNALDYSGYPDCRPEFIDAFRKVAETGQKQGVEGQPVKIETPLIDLTKADIVRLAVENDVPLELTWSCYAGGDVPCGKCDSCRLRAKGFEEAGIQDPALVLSNE